MGPQRSALLFVLVVAASLLSASLADGQRKLIVHISRPHVGSAVEGYYKKQADREEPFVVAHPRILTVKTNDYGSYDPSPALAKPPFKLIPN